MATTAFVDEFEALRPHLMAVAYRLTGTVADAEDIVQDAWLRWSSAEPESIIYLLAWLTTVFSRFRLPVTLIAMTPTGSSAITIGPDTPPA